MLFRNQVCLITFGMIRALIYTIPFVIGVAMYEQHDYEIIYERIEVINYNRDFVKFVKTHNYKYNRTQAVSNITIVYNVDFGNKLKIQVQAYKMASNEYRLFPATLTINLCDAIEKDEFGFRNFYLCGNFTTCPMVKGHYYICKWSPIPEKFPPYIPEGHYMADLNYVYFSTVAYHLQIYATVRRPFKYPKK